MPTSSPRFEISLQDIAPHLRASMGDSGYRDWSANLEREILAQLVKHGIQARNASISREALEPGTSKSATLFILGTLGLTIAGGGIATWDPERTGKVLKAVWAALKKVIPQKTHIKIRQVRRVPKGGNAPSEHEFEVEVDASPDQAEKLVRFAYTVSQGTSDTHVSIKPKGD